MPSKIPLRALVLTTLMLSVTIAQTDLLRTMKKGQLMAADEATLKMADDMAYQRDFEAIGELMQLGRLDISDGSEKVAYVKVHMFGGKIDVRKKGSAKVWWINIER